MHASMCLITCRFQAHRWSDASSVCAVLIGRSGDGPHRAGPAVPADAHAVQYGPWRTTMHGEEMQSRCDRYAGHHATAQGALRSDPAPVMVECTTASAHTLCSRRGRLIAVELDARALGYCRHTTTARASQQIVREVCDPQAPARRDSAAAAERAVLTAISGVKGRGKSGLTDERLAGFEDAIARLEADGGVPVGHVNLCRGHSLGKAGLDKPKSSLPWVQGRCLVPAVLSVNTDEA